MTYRTRNIRTLTQELNPGKGWTGNESQGVEPLDVMGRKTSLVLGFLRGSKSKETGRRGDGRVYVKQEPRLR